MNLYDLARQHFGLDLPCTEDALKSAYRIAAKQLHTDLGGNKDAFIAFDELENGAVVCVEHILGERTEPKTTEQV